MSCICRTCLSEITSNRYVDINLTEFARKQLTLCIPELNVDLVLEPVLCMKCVDALDAAYHFKSCCLQTEQRIKAHMETLTIEQQHVELDAVLGDNYNGINSMATSCGNDITNNLNIVHDHSRTRRDLEDYKDAKRECSVTSENCSDTLFDDGLEENHEGFKEESITIEEHDWDSFIKSEMFDTGTDAEGLLRQCDKLDPVNYNANNENCNSVTKSAEFATKQGNTVTKSQEEVVSMEPNNSSSSVRLLRQRKVNVTKIADVSNIHSIKRSLKNISSIKSRSTTNNLCKRANRRVSYRCRQKEKNIKEQIVAKSELHSELLRERRMVLTRMDISSAEEILNVDNYAVMKGVGTQVKKSSLKCDRNIKSNNTAATEAEADVNSVIERSQLHLKHSNTSAVSFQHFINSNNLSLQVKNQELSVSSHFRNTITKNLYKCDQCDYACSQKSSLKLHIRNHSGKKLHKCNVCKYASSKKSYLNNHLRGHSGKKSYECSQCDYACSRKYNLIKHIRNHTGKKPYKCDQCDYACSRKDMLIVHIRHHTGEQPYKCNVCNYGCSAKTLFNRHLRTHTGEKPYKCGQCDYACSTNCNLVVHIRKHTGEKPYQCDQCDYACSSKSSLNTHRRTHTGEKPYKCDQCEYASAESGHLNRHMKKHSEERPFKCDQCDFASSYKRSLNIHLKTHTREKSYKCDHCKYTNALRSQLIRHMKKHSGEKPYKCDQCDFASSYKPSLNNHLKTHTREKSYKCDHCKYTYALRSQLIRHMKKHSGEKPY